MQFTRLHSSLIITLVLCSLTGLSTIQFSWLKGAMVIQERKIQEKLDRVVEQIKLSLEETSLYGTTTWRELDDSAQFLASAKSTVDSVMQAENLQVEYGFESNSCSSGAYTWYSQEGLKPKKENACEIHLDGLKFINKGGKLDHLHLYVFLPHRDRLIFREMSLAIGSSILFMLLLIGAFGYMLWTIFRQKKLSEMKNDFINNLTHEFKTPLASVSLAARTLKRLPTVQNSEKAMSYVNLIDQEGRRLDNHIDKILQMAAIDSGNFRLDKQEVDIHEIIRKVKESLSLMVEKSGGRINLHLQAFQPILIADAMHLFNMIYNLVDNAIKYNQNHPQIFIDSKGNEQELQIDIRDNGIGMSSEAQKQVFDQFFRQPTGDVHNVKGFGLGLAYVKRMVQAHNGRIELQSQLGKGTTFSLIFPRN